MSPRVHRWSTAGAVVAASVAAVLLSLGAASATCAVVPFDQVVRESGAVVVGTVVDARPAGAHRSGVIVRLDVDQVLRGTDADGNRVRMSSCGPPITGSAARFFARHVVGQRDLFLLGGHGSTLYAFADVTSPQGMTLEQRIARARTVLGLPPATPSAEDSSQWRWLVAASICVLVAISAVIGLRSARQPKSR
jgi:hypothetical protein